MFFFLVCLLCTGITGHTQSNQDREAVEKIVRVFQEDFNDGGFNNAVNYTTDDWVHINPGGGIDTGRNNVLKTVRTVHQSFLKGVTMKIEKMDTRFITKDVAIADVVHVMDTYITPGGDRHENERQIKTYVLVKKNGKWLLAQDQNTIVSQQNTN